MASTAQSRADQRPTHEPVSLPRPVQAEVPIIIGGGTKPAVRRAARLGQGLFPTGVADAETPALLEMLRTETEAAGRPPETVEVSVAEFDLGLDALSRTVEQNTALGVERIVLPVLTEDELRTLAAGLSDRFGLDLDEDANVDVDATAVDPITG